jgi:hypothetical protein
MPRDEERRMFSRAPLVLEIELRGLGPDGEPTGARFSGVTVDVGAGGVRVGGAALAFAVGDRVAFAARGGDGERVEGIATVVALYGEHAGLRFEFVPPGARTRLSGLVLRHHRECALGTELPSPRDCLGHRAPELLGDLGPEVERGQRLGERRVAAHRDLRRAGRGDDLLGHGAAPLGDDPRSA